MKVKKSNSGVSEVVGSVLILIITVTMFAVVMLWVLSYPTPSGRAYVDLNAEVNDLNITHKYVNITHTGGESLENSYTDIYVYINGSLAGSKSYKISDADNYATIGDSLSVGETWSKTFSIISTSTVYVMIVDTKGSEVIYDETLQGVSGDNVPVIAFACTVPTSVPADNSTPFKVYAYILDPDKDVSTVTVNLSSVGKGAYSMTSTDGIIFQKTSLKIYIGTSAGRYMLQINVTDSNSNNATGYVWITVTDPSVLGGGGFATEGSSYGSQGFMITNDFNSTTDIRIFNYTDTIWVKMASNVLTNVEIKNIFTMKDVYGNILTPPTSSNAFVYYKYDSGYYFYVYSFDVQTDIQGFDDTTGGVYPTHIELKDYSGHVFIVDTTIIVKDINGNIPSYGILKTYSKPECNDTDESTWFDSEGMMYVKVFTKTVDISLSSVVVGNIEIRDFIGGAQVKRRPGNEPVSNITIVGGNYSFSINLSNANQD
ncbi:MAG: type IV pilin N-terminal domain-containing protein, partial [Thermoplasmatales archaeon]|nr:type IV pilin N-terminal domain-containing protein [Thermoplasmatales archaeon]